MKKARKFAYGDSLKLTLAFMMSENFHTSLDQDPNYADSTVVDLSDGLDVSLYDQGGMTLSIMSFGQKEYLILRCSILLRQDGELQKRTAGTVRTEPTGT